MHTNVFIELYHVNEIDLILSNKINQQFKYLSKYLFLTHKNDIDIPTNNLEGTFNGLINI